MILLLNAGFSGRPVNVERVLIELKKTGNGILQTSKVSDFFSMSTDLAVTPSEAWQDVLHVFIFRFNWY